MTQSYRSHRSPGLGYGDLIELTEIPGTVRKCYRAHRSRVLWHGRAEPTYVRKMIYPYPGYPRHWRTEHPVVPGTGDQGCGRGGTPIFTGVFEPFARVALYPTDEDGLGICFGAA